MILAATFALLALGFAPLAGAQATVITSVLPQVSNAFGGPYPGPVTEVGSFSYTVPRGTIISGVTISGTFGNSVNNTSAATRVFLNGNLVATCVINTTCYNPSTTAPTAWSFTLPDSEAVAVANGTATLTWIQDSPTTTQLGVTTLTLQVGSAVPALDVRALAALALLLACVGAWILRARLEQRS
jgi:hypothetical protein